LLQAGSVDDESNNTKKLLHRELAFASKMLKDFIRGDVFELCVINVLWVAD